MYSVKVAFILILLFVERTSGNTNSNKTIDCSPCICGHELYNTTTVWPTMNCTIKNDTELEKGIRRAGTTENTLYFLSSEYLNRIDENTFGKVTLKSLQIHKTVIGEFHLFSAFQGMEETLTKLDFHRVTVHQWIYSTGEKFHKLHRFRLKSCPSSTPRWKKLYNILYTFPRNIRYFIIRSCELKSQDMFGFNRFTNLTEIKLSSNKLQSVDRCYFPRPALQLVSIELSSNPITYLPDDMFRDMPALKKLRLDGLNLTTLHEHIFKPIFTQLNEFSINDVPLVCDCNAAWLLTRNDSLGTYNFSCTPPDSLSGPSRVSLRLSDLSRNCSKLLDYNIIDSSGMPDSTNLLDVDKEITTLDYGGITKNVTEIAVSCYRY